MNEAVAENEAAPEYACVMPHDKPAEASYGLICSRHHHWFYRTLDTMLELYALLPEVLLPEMTSRIDGERHGTRVGSPAPGRLDAMAVTDRSLDEHGNSRIRTPDAPGDELWYEGEGSHMPAVVPSLQSWISLVWEEREIDPPVSPAAIGPACAACQHITCQYVRGAPFRDGDWLYRAGRWQIPDDMTTVTRILRREQRWIEQQSWVDDYATEIEMLHRALARAIGETMWPKPIGKCPNDQAPMYNTIGADEVTCRRCGKTWAGVDLVRLRLIHEQEEAKRQKRRAEQLAAQRKATTA